MVYVYLERLHLDLLNQPSLRQTSPCVYQSCAICVHLRSPVQIHPAECCGDVSHARTSQVMPEVVHVLHVCFPSQRLQSIYQTSSQKLSVDPYC